MNTPVARKLAAADARRVAAARAARAAAASRRVAAAKRRMLVLSVLGALTVSGWILTAMVSLPWVVPAILTALSVGAVELGRRAAAAGAKADEELAKRVRLAERRAGITPEARRSEDPAGKTAIRTASIASPAATAAPAEESPHAAPAEQDAAPSLRVEVDPAKPESTAWTPVPVPPPAYTLKAEVRRKLAEPYEAPTAEKTAAEKTAAEETSAEGTAQVEGPPEAEKVPGSVPSLPVEKSEAEQEPEAATGSLNVQEILARRRAVG